MRVTSVRRPTSFRQTHKRAENRVRQKPCHLRAIEEFLREKGNRRALARCGRSIEVVFELRTFSASEVKRERADPTCVCGPLQLLDRTSGHG
jgi:hypothetical protein